MKSKLSYLTNILRNLPPYNFKFLTSLILLMGILWVISQQLKASPGLAQGNPPERVKVMVEDLTEATAADFTRGQTRGVEIREEAGRGVLRSAQGGEFTSGVLVLPFPATHLGLHWVASGVSPESFVASVRTSQDGESWSIWQGLTVEAVAGAPAGQEAFAALAGVNRPQYVQYQVVFPKGQIAILRGMTVTVINSVDGPREPLTAGARTAQTFTTPDGKQFTVVTREGWGCNESLRFKAKKETWPEMYVPVKKIVLHHTATSNTYTDGAAEVRAIYTYHARTLRWGDIGYNVLIDKFGNIYEGRHGRGESSASREILSADVVAGHDYHYNYGSTGLVAIGNFDEVQPASGMLISIGNLVTFESGRHYIYPYGNSSFLRSDDVWNEGMNNISGHDETYATNCPGVYLKDYLPALRDEVARRLRATNDAPALREKDNASRELKAPAVLSFEWLAPSGSYFYSLEGWYKSSSGDNINYLSGYTAGNYNDSLAKKQQWQATTATNVSFSNLAVGHYAMHVRSASGLYEANLTFLVK